MISITPTPAEVVGATKAFSFEAFNQRWVLLVAYAFLLLVYLVISGYATSRMWHLRVKGDSTGTVIIVFGIFTLILFIGTLFYALTVKWSGNIF